MKAYLKSHQVLGEGRLHFHILPMDSTNWFYFTSLQISNLFIFSSSSQHQLLELLKRNSLESGSLQPLAVVVGVEDQARWTQMFNFYGKAVWISWLDVYSLPIYATWGKNKIFGWVKETVGGSGRRRSVNRAESYPSEVSGNFHQCTDHRWKQWPYNSTTWLCQKYSEYKIYNIYMSQLMCKVS